MKPIFTLIILLALTSSLTAQGGFQNKSITFKKEVFEQNLKSQLASQTVGYQAVVLKDGKIVSEIFGGNARRGDDGNLKMEATTAINIGSLFKFISGTAMLNLLEKGSTKMASDIKNLSLEQKLDRRIWGDFPALWIDVIAKPSVPSPTQRSISYRQLLQHRSGFDNDWQPSSKEELDGDGNREFLPFLEKGFNKLQFDDREYTNMNFVLTGHLIPLLENKAVRTDLNFETWNPNKGEPFKMTQEQADLKIRTKLGNIMDKLMSQRIWSKMSPKFNLTCDPTNNILFKHTAAYGYEAINDNTGVITSGIDKRGYCGGEGGYYMSARDFANYIAHLTQTDLIVSKTTYDLMFNDKMNDYDDRLVWSSALEAREWEKKNFGVTRIARSSGGTRGTRTIFLRMPLGYYVIIFSNTTNSVAGQDGNQLTKFGRDAFEAAMKHNFD